jgi:hypothetical protein
VSGRLVYLASLRDVNSGTYKHHGLFTAFGRDEAVRALRDSHREAFQSWLNLSLAEKNDDLKEYLRSLENPREEVIEYWLQSGVYRSYVPATAMEMETELFCRDLETLLQLLQNEAINLQLHSGAAARDQDSLPPA